MEILSFFQTLAAAASFSKTLLKSTAKLDTGPVFINRVAQDFF